MKYEEVEKFIQSNPEFKSRKDQYRAMSLYFGIEDETIKEMMSFNRYLRSIWPVDEIGLAKEKTYHKSPDIHNYENRLFKLSTIL